MHCAGNDSIHILIVDLVFFCSSPTHRKKMLLQRLNILLLQCGSWHVACSFFPPFCCLKHLAAASGNGAY